MSSRKFLVLGSGGREHAIAWKLASAPDASTLTTLPPASLNQTSSLILHCSK